MPTPPAGRTPLPIWDRPAALFAVVAFGYLLGSEAAFRIADAADLQAVFFIPAGITVAALLRAPLRWWWVVLAAAALAELVQDLRSGLALDQSTGFVLANVVEPLLAASIIRRGLRRPIDLCRLRDVCWFVGGAVVAGPLVGALIGAAADRSLGGDRFLTTFGQWWLGDALGALLVGGVIIAFGSSQDRRAVRSWSGLVLVCGSSAVTAVVLAASDLPLLFTALTGVVVAGALFGVRAVTLTSLVAALTAAVTLAVDQGDVIVGVADTTGVLIVKLKFLVFTIGGLIVAAEVFERDLMTIERARLDAAADEEHRLVDRLQRMLLPPARMHGAHYEAHGRYLPASAGLEIGGDWYDASELPDGRVFVSVGDVVGHGPEAAATMSQMKVAISVLASDAGDVSTLLGRLDEAAARIPGALCTTAWVGYFDPSTGVLSYAAAGHLPGFLTIGDRVLRLDGKVSPPVLVDPGGPKPSAEVRVDGPASLLLYTDGLVERRGESIDRGLERVAATLADGARSARPPIDALVDLELDARDDTVLFQIDLRPDVPLADLAARREATTA